MTTEQRLAGRISLLQDLHCAVDEEMLYVVYNRSLDMPLVQLKYMNKPKFSKFLEDIQELFVTYNAI